MPKSRYRERCQFSSSHTAPTESQTSFIPHIRRKLLKVGMTFLWRTVGRLLLLRLWIEDIKLCPTVCEKQQCLSASFIPALICSRFNPLTSGVPATICNGMTKCSLSASSSYKAQVWASAVTDSSQGLKEHYIICMTAEHNTWQRLAKLKYWKRKECKGHSTEITGVAWR